MSEPRTIRVKIADIRYDLDSTLDSAISKLQEHKRIHEADGFTDLEIDISPYDEYGSASVDVELYGFRMETNAEVEKRDAQEKATLRQAEANARRQYEALKAKFG